MIYQRDAIRRCSVLPMYMKKALLQQLICKWLSCVDGFVEQGVGSLVDLTDVGGRCCNYCSKKVNLANRK